MGPVIVASAVSCAVYAAIGPTSLMWRFLERRAVDHAAQVCEMHCAVCLYNNIAGIIIIASMLGGDVERFSAH